jgi:hypothetical protein
LRNCGFNRMKKAPSPDEPDSALCFSGAYRCLVLFY